MFTASNTAYARHMAVRCEAFLHFVFLGMKKLCCAHSKVANHMRISRRVTFTGHVTCVYAMKFTYIFHVVHFVAEQILLVRSHDDFEGIEDS